MDVADEVNVVREMGQDALAAVSTIAADQDLVLRKPSSDQGNQLNGQFGTGAMMGIGLGFGLGHVHFT